jgi:uncharacterized membrane protein
MINIPKLFQNISRKRLLTAFTAGTSLAILLEFLLVVFRKLDCVPFIALGIAALILLFLFNWLDLHFIRDCDDFDRPAA